MYPARVKSSFLSVLALMVGLLSILADACVIPRDQEQQEPLGRPPNATTTSRTFSVGFSIQSSYGAAAIIFETEDGELETHTRVRYGNEDYQSVMAKLAAPSSRHSAPPYDDMGDFFDDRPRKILRENLKKIGVPASPEVGVLSSVIKNLRSDLEYSFDIKISEAVFASTHLPALYPDDLEDIAYDAGIKYVTPKKQSKPMVWETAAAWAGYGLGLCEHWRDEKECEDEYEDMPELYVIPVHYSRTAFGAGLASIGPATGTLEPADYHQLNFSLGGGDIAKYSPTKEYWDGIERTLLHTVREYPHLRKPRKMMFTGDMIHSAGFIDFVQQAVEREIGYVPDVLMEHSVTAAARGAAEFMRRGAAALS